MEVFRLPSVNPLHVSKDSTTVGVLVGSRAHSHYISHRPPPSCPLAARAQWKPELGLAKQMPFLALLTLKQLTHRSRDNGDFILLLVATSSVE